MNIKKGDQVKIMRGKDRGKTGSVMRVFVDLGKATIDGINLYKKRNRPKQQGKKGETVLVPRPLPISNVMLMSETHGRPVRLGFSFNDSGEKVRVARGKNLKAEPV